MNSPADEPAAHGAVKAAASGPGAVGDALDPLVDALTAASKAAEKESPGDPKVVAAVKVGWLMQELTKGVPPSPPISGLSETEAYEAQVLQLKSLLATLKVEGLDLTPMTEALQPGQPPGRALDEAKALAPKVLVALFGLDSRFVKAYALGRELRSWIGTKAEVPARSLIAALDSLSSDLPSHAARGVAISMSQWSQSTDDHEAALRTAQVDLWRAVITGEKKGTEVLEPSNYIDAAKELEKKVAKRAVRSPLLIVVATVAVLLLAGAVVAAILLHGSVNKVVVAATGVLSAVGLTWKGIGGTLGKLLGKLETPLWGAELDTAIADAITLTTKQRQPSPEPGGLGYADRRERALQAAPEEAR